MAPEELRQLLISILNQVHHRKLVFYNFNQVEGEFYVSDENLSNVALAYKTTINGILGQTDLSEDQRELLKTFMQKLP